MVLLEESGLPKDYSRIATQQPQPRTTSTSECRFLVPAGSRFKYLGEIYHQPNVPGCLKEGVVTVKGIPDIARGLAQCAWNGPGSEGVSSTLEDCRILYPHWHR